MTNRQNPKRSQGSAKKPPRNKSKKYTYGSLDHILAVLDRLDDLYGYDGAPSNIFATGEPLDGLMLTLLSQNTNDRNRDMAYEELRAYSPDWESVADLSAEKISDLIRPAGLGDTKSVRMKSILATIKNDFGEYSLKGMFGWSPERVREYLSSLPGIGPKTVACVMVFDLDMPAFPVDTHVARLSKRFGWAAEKATPEKIQIFLEDTVPPERCRGGHLNVIEHGRKVCHARKPECARCNATDLCKYFADLAEGAK